MQQTKRAKRTFSPQFKPGAIEQVLKHQHSVKNVTLEMELEHLRKWIPHSG